MTAANAPLSSLISLFSSITVQDLLDALDVIESRRQQQEAEAAHAAAPLSLEDVLLVIDETDTKASVDSEDDDIYVSDVEVDISSISAEDVDDVDNTASENNAIDTTPDTDTDTDTDTDGTADEPTTTNNATTTGEANAIISSATPALATATTSLPAAFPPHTTSLLPLASYIQRPAIIDEGDRFYVVSVGTSVGIFYPSWNAVSPYVTGRPGAVFCRARTYEIAVQMFSEAYINGHVRIL